MVVNFTLQIASLLALALFGLKTHAAINIDGFSSTVNNRFANDPSFIASSMDLSGVAIADTSASLGSWDDGGRWVTMISPNVFLSVQHASFYPANGQSVTFYANNDPSGSTSTRTVLSSQQIGSSDIRIGRLDAPLPSGFTFYNYATATFDVASNPPTIPAGAIVETALAPYYGANAYLFGRSPSVLSTETDMAVGRNILDRWVIDAAGTHDAVVAIRDSSGDPNYTSSEAYLVVGDSGGPMMVETSPGELTIVGLNWFVGTLGDGTQINGFSYVGNYSNDIDQYLALYSVPEPGSLGLIIGLIASLFTLRDRMRQRTHR